jgi:hypothetical protein
LNNHEVKKIELEAAVSDAKIRQDAGFWHAQGIEAVSFFAAGKKDTSV